MERGSSVRLTLLLSSLKRKRLAVATHTAHSPACFGVVSLRPGLHSATAWQVLRRSTLAIPGWEALKATSESFKYVVEAIAQLAALSPGQAKALRPLLGMLTTCATCILRSFFN